MERWRIHAGTNARSTVVTIDGKELPCVSKVHFEADADNDYVQLTLFIPKFAIEAEGLADSEHPIKVTPVEE